MLTLRWVFVFAVTALSAVNLASQTTNNPRARASASTCLWVGTIDVAKNYLGRIETLAGTLRFEMEENIAWGERYTLIGGTLTWSASGTYGQSIVKGGPYRFDVAVDSLDWGYLIIDPNGHYDGRASFQQLIDQNELVTLITENGSIKTGPILTEMIIGSETDSNFVQNGRMSGNYTLTLIPDLYYASYTWDFHKESVGETKLSVESAAYDDWVPAAAPSGTGSDIGSKIKFKAKLTDADGNTPCAKADSFKFELKNVSHEPGVCMNFPRAEAAENDRDLRFTPELSSPADRMSADSLTLVTPEGREAAAEIASFDWGGWGTLTVTAYMPGGKTIAGFLNGHPEITDILLPKRNAASKIADKWKIDNGVEGLADDDDSESEPAGDRDPGDGYTLYEEYRGFFEKGEHMYANPKKKDFFIFSEIADYYPGIQLFAGVTGLNVHYRLYGFEEFDRRVRVMNFNHAQGPHQNFDQHGLWIQTVSGLGYSFASRLGPPKNVDSVNISATAVGFRSIMRGSMREITNELNVTVAHELGHAVHIEHHGDADPQERTWTTVFPFDLATGTFTIEFSEAGRRGPILPQWENGRPFTKSLRGNVYLAAWGGEHCGVEDCIMRYDCAYAYIPGPGLTSDIRYVVQGTERTGLFLCDKKEDAPGGVNNLSRNPRSRYGSAVNGNCRSQICVNDKYH